MTLRLHHVLVVGGLVVGLAIASVLDTEPRLLAWIFGAGAGIAGGAFAAAIVSGVPLAGGPAGPRGRRAAPPPWFEDREEPPRNGTH